MAKKKGKKNVNNKNNIKKKNEKQINTKENTGTQNNDNEKKTDMTLEKKKKDDIVLGKTKNGNVKSDKSKKVAPDTKKEKAAVSNGEAKGETPTLDKNDLVNIASIKKAAEEKPEESPKENTDSENMLELSAMTRKQKRAAKRAAYKEYTKNMSFFEKCSYFIAYYKWYVILPICAVLFISYVAVTVYRNTRPVALAYAILNVGNTEELDTSFHKDYAEHYNFSDDYTFSAITKFAIDYDYFQQNSEFIMTSNSTDYNILSTQCELGDFDVLISNATGVKYCSTSKMVKALKGYFDVNQYAALEPYMAEFEDANGTMRPYAIDISDTEFARKLNPGYSDVYIIFPGASERNKKNSLQLLEYIYGIDLDGN